VKLLRREKRLTADAAFAVVVAELQREWERIAGYEAHPGAFRALVAHYPLPVAYAAVEPSATWAKGQDHQLSGTKLKGSLDRCAKAAWDQIDANPRTRGIAAQR
jgi:hypothetical protein